MRRFHFLSPMVFLTTISCGDNVVHNESSGVEVEVVGELMLRPGEYRRFGELKELDYSGVSDDDMGVYVAQIGAFFAEEYTFCISSDQETAGYRDYLIQSQDEHGHCEYLSFELVGSDLDATIRCEATDDTTTEVTAWGTITATSHDLIMSYEARNVGQNLRNHLTVRFQAERVGDCPPGSTGTPTPTP